MKKLFHILSLLCIILLQACSGSSDPLPSTVSDESQVIQIISYSFIPDTLTVVPGQVIYFFNQDDSYHHILSQSAEDTFDDTGDFDSGLFGTDTPAFITIPATASSGDVFYFYDDVLQDGMNTPNGILTVE